LVDLYGDGHSDILSGSYSRMEKEMAGLFQVLRGKPDGSFSKAEVLNGTDGKPLIIPLNGKPMTENICTRPFAADWDGDGHLDLVVGNFSGTFYWFKGEGHGKFRPEPELIKVKGGEPLKIHGHHSDPFVIDWDGDGALDLISGSTDGGVQWAKNRAGKGQPPEFDGFEWLVKPGRSVEYGQLLSEDELTGPTTSTRVWVADVNGDGKLDLLVGDSVTLISPAGGVSAEEFKKKFAEWQKAVDAASREMSSQTADQAKRTKANEDFNKLYQQRTEFMKEDRTGFVWVYLQK
jgi:hypothetical protein